MSVIWFRKCLRVHDNPSLIAAIDTNLPILPIFILDPNFIKFGRCGVNRWNFLFQSLQDLNNSLENLGSSLTVFRGNPNEIFEILFKSGEIKNLYFEKDTEPYAKVRDESVNELCIKNKINIETFLGHTLYDFNEVIKANKGITPVSYGKLLSIIKNFPKIKDCTRDPIKSEIIQFKVTDKFLKSINYKGKISIPKLDELTDKSGKKLNILPTTSIYGGETLALQRMYEYLKDKKQVANFEKPKTNPSKFNPAETTILSPYLKFGCLSIKKFYHELNEVLLTVPKHSQPPCSLMGQIYWREFFYCGSVGIPNFHKMENNPICRQINWRLKNLEDKDDEAKLLLDAWTNGETGYPWIDAIMKQLKQEGWIHHLARHSVACFLTRGDLYINWERGMEVFEEMLLDADYALNAGNWMWLSGTSSYFALYFRVYSPVAFPKKYDPNGDFVRKYLPVLKNMPKEYIYEPWNAPKSLQEKLGCIVGRDYPERIVIHEIVSKENLSNLSKYFGKNKLGNPENAEDEDDESLKNRKKDDKNKSKSVIKPLDEECDQVGMSLKKQDTESNKNRSKSERKKQEIISSSNDKTESNFSRNKSSSNKYNKTSKKDNNELYKTNSKILDMFNKAEITTQKKEKIIHNIDDKTELEEKKVTKDNQKNRSTLDNFVSKNQKKRLFSETGMKDENEKIFKKKKK